MIKTLEKACALLAQGIFFHAEQGGRWPCCNATVSDVCTDGPPPLLLDDRFPLVEAAFCVSLA